MAKLATVYFQQFTSKTGQVPSIGGWTTSCDDGTIFVYEVKFASNGMVEDISKIATPQAARR